VLAVYEMVANLQEYLSFLQIWDIWLKMSDINCLAIRRLGLSAGDWFLLSSDFSRSDDDIMIYGKV